MFCPNCGKSNPEGIMFCTDCGTKIGETIGQNAPQQSAPPPYPQQPQYQQPSTSVTDNTKLFSILSYVGILFLIGLIAAPQNNKVKFHVNQGCVLFIAEIVLGIAVGILGAILNFLPYSLDTLLSGLMSFAVYGGSLALAVMGIINASKGEEKQLPIIGKFTIIK